MSNSVEVRNLTKTYGHKHACDGIDFFAEEKSITGILGINGAGKSTLLKIVSGLLYPTEGSVSVNGRVGYMSESFLLDNGLTVREALLFEIGIFGTDMSCFEYAVEKCSLHDVLSCKISTLSRGYRQRVMFALILCENPDILVLDEATQGLDPLQASSFRKTLKSISGSKTVIFSTHNIDEAVSLCDRLYMLEKGKVMVNGTPEEILESTGCHSVEDAFVKLMEENKS